MPSASPPVACQDCGRTWNSPTMAEGLRLLGSCPRCGGTLRFEAEQDPPARNDAPGRPAAELAPHLVLGLPRR